jgi:ankyrin repeat protein
MSFPSNPEFDEAVRILMETPTEFPKLLATSPGLLHLRGLHNESLLHYLAVEEEPDAVRVLLALGATTDVVNRFGNTPLHDVATLGNVEIAKVLLEYGADLHAKSPDGSTALHYAADYGNHDLYNFLLRAGADPALLNQFGETPAKLLDGYESDSQD